MKYRLRGSGPFTVVDGPLAGRQFMPGIEYDEIPPQDAARFEEVKQRKGQVATQKTTPSAAKAEADKNGKAEGGDDK